jgi:hypothetical protein
LGRGPSPDGAPDERRWKVFAAHPRAVRARPADARRLSSYLHDFVVRDIRRMLIVVLATVGSYAVGWLVGVPVLVPILNAAVPWWLMARRLRRGAVREAIALMLIWAMTMAVTATVMAAAGWATRRDGSSLFLRSFYRDQMLHWVRTGVGPESVPSEFVPTHLAHAAIFAVAAGATGGLLAMPMGAALVNQMSEYVGALAASGSHPIATAALAWHPWAVIRVIGFVMIGVVLSGIVLSRVLHFPYAISLHRGWLTAGVALLGLDVLLKWLLAPTWALLLRGLVGW